MAPPGPLTYSSLPMAFTRRVGRLDCAYSAHRPCPPPPVQPLKTLRASVLALAAGGTAPGWSADDLAPSPQVPSPWLGTGLDLGFFDQRVTSTACRKDDVALLSCIGSVQRVLDLAGRDLYLVPASGPGQGKGLRRLIVQFGAAAVLEDQGLRVRSEGNALEVVRALARRLGDWREALRNPQARAVDFDALAAWIKREVVEPGRREDFVAAAISGYLTVADAHANLLPAGELRRTSGTRPGRTSEGEQGLASQGPVYTGIGAAVQPMVDAALVTSILRGAPAADAGLRVDDFILEIDGVSTAGLSVEALVGRLRGGLGSQVELRVKRQGRVLTLEVTRDAVKVANVVSQSLNDRGWQLAYLKIDSFLPPDTCRAFTRELERQLKPTLNGILLDLRDNAGGLIDQAVCIADLFLGEDQVVLEVRDLEDPTRTKSIRTRRPARARMPLVTLVNARTGSASEVLAGALQDHGRSFVVGELTFGKGTVQTVRPWRGSKSVLELYTASRYYRPSGVGVQLKGIEPEIEALDQPAADRVVLREGDLFPTALPQEPEVWQHPNPELVERLRRCTQGQGLSQHRLAREHKEGRVGDYPLAVGQDALVCRLTERL